MLVTDKQFYMDNALVKYLDLQVERLDRKLDCWNVCDGDEGTGKSNFAMAICYYVAWKTGRKFDLDNVFFDVDKFIDFAKSTKHQVICWDEAALGGLSDMWQSKIQQKLIQLSMVCRKKGHFIIMNIPKFFKLREYLILDRSIALFHVYSPDMKTNGRFVLFGKDKKEQLYYDWKIRKKRSYKSHWTLRGKFIEALPLILDEEKYDAKKDEAILSIGAVKDEKVNRYQKYYLTLVEKVLGVPEKLCVTKKDFCAALGINQRCYQKWARELLQTPKARALISKSGTVGTNLTTVEGDKEDDDNGGEDAAE